MVPASWDIYVGPAAGLFTSVLWTGTSLVFTAAGRRIGPTAVNAFRIGLAIIILTLIHRLRFGIWVPEAVAGQVFYLALSGVIGLAIGDQALFTSFVDIGPRLAMLLLGTAPIFAAWFGWLALGERLHGIAWIGMTLTIVGVAWVVLERPADGSVARTGHRLRGVILGIIAAGCQAGGLLLSKQGIGHGWLPVEQHLDPQAATLGRMVFAGVGVLPILTFHALRQRARTAGGRRPLRIGSPRAGYLFAACGAVIGPSLGVWMSLVASDRAPLGVAQTLCSLPPVFILPFAVLIHKERISPRAILGALVAVGGTAILFLHPR
ncbi:MAG: DMT family transporter [Phycisphaerae bacterium]|nr:DMT family transporter [Phycisphaerae bacterium]